MLFGEITGLEKKVSKIILGNDKQKTYSSASKLWIFILKKEILLIIQFIIEMVKVKNFWENG